MGSEEDLLCEAGGEATPTLTTADGKYAGGRGSAALRKDRRLAIRAQDQTDSKHSQPGLGMPRLALRSLCCQREV